MMTSMTVPDWRTSTAGTRTRVALWLHHEVGVHGTFTKAQLRDAFPAVEQVDRRMRDLRSEGWVLSTYREDRSLSVDELRLVTEGGAVWERGYRSKAAAGVSDKERLAIFAADDYTCSYCGVSGGEPYSDDPLRTAKLTLSRVPGLDGTIQLRTTCDRCHVAAPVEVFDDSALRLLRSLDEGARAQLRSWVRKGVRKPPPEEALWNLYRRLPRDSRAAFESALLANE